jgi:hypothetical protein
VPIVKSVLVRLRSDGAKQAKADMDGLAVRARELAAMDPTIKLSVEDRAAMARLAALRFQLQALKASGDRVGLNRVAGELRLLGANADSPRAKLAALRLEMLALREAIGGGGGPGGAAGGGGSLIGSIGGPGVAIGIGAALTALTSGLGGVIPMLAAATLGVGAFGALALPTFMKVTGAVSQIAADTLAYSRATTAASKNTALQKIRDDWKALDPAQRQAVHSIQALQKMFSQMAKAFEPVVMPLFNQALRTVRTLLPDLLPLAKSAAGGIGELLKGFDGFAKSPGFKAFMANMSQLAGPSIKVIGEGLAQITIALFKLVVSLENPNMFRAAKYFFEGIAGVINGLAWFIAGSTVMIVRLLHDTAVAFDHARHTIADFAHNVAAHFGEVRHATAHTFDAMRHDVADFAHQAAAHFDEVRHTVATWAHNVAHAFDVFRAAQGKFGAFQNDITWGFNHIRHVTAVVLDFMRHETAVVFHFIWHTAASAVDQTRHAIASAFDAIRGTLARWAADTGRFVDRAVAWFRGLPGRVLGVLAGLPGMLFSAGSNAIGRLAAGMLSRIGDIISAGKTIASKVAGFFGLSPAKEGPLSGGGAPEIRGAHFARDFARGLAGQSGYVGGAAGVMARAAGPAGGPGGGGHGGVLRLEVVGGGGGMLDQLFITWLKNYVRVTGGGGPQSVQRSLGQVWR